MGRKNELISFAPLKEPKKIMIIICYVSTFFKTEMNYLGRQYENMCRFLQDHFLLFIIL